MSEESAMSRHEPGEIERDVALPDETDVVGGALSVADTDPELIAFKLWNEGRVDEAIRFLEQEAAAERRRRSASQDVDSAILFPDNTKVEPVSDWRDRHRAALEPARFNAYGSAVHTIDLVAGPGDGILPHAPRVRRRAGWIMGIGVAVLAVSAAGAFWGGGPAVLKQAALPFIGSSVQDPMESPAPSEEVSEPTAVATAPAEASDPVPPPAAAAADAEPIQATAVDDEEVPPPDDEAVPDEGAPDTADNSGTPAANAAPAAAPEELTEAPDSEQAASTDAGPTPPPAPRLPRQRPEPPRQTASSPPRIGAPPSTLDDQRLRLAGVPAPALRYFRRYSPYPDPRTVYYDPRTVRPLTPAEYQSLVARRAWAQDYAARQRALAEWRMRQRRHPWDDEPPQSED